MKVDHRSPAVERAIEILTVIARHGDGIDLPNLVAECAIPRSTVYRILNTLESGAIVSRKLRDGKYAIGLGLLELATSVQTGLATEDIIRVARPHLESLASRTGQTSKITITTRQSAVCVDAVHGDSDFTLMARTNRPLPLHAGAASRVLLASLDPDDLELFLQTPLKRYTENTITAPDKLRTNLAKVSNQGWAFDSGEHSDNIRAFAAPVTAHNGAVIAAVSVIFFSSLKERRHPELRNAVIEAAAAISRDFALHLTGVARQKPPRG